MSDGATNSPNSVLPCLYGKKGDIRKETHVCPFMQSEYKNDKPGTKEMVAELGGKGLVSKWEENDALLNSSLYKARAHMFHVFFCFALFFSQFLEFNLEL